MCFVLLFLADITFLQIKGLWQPYIKQVYQCSFSIIIFSLYVFILHFGNSCNISIFFFNFQLNFKPIDGECCA